MSEIPFEALQKLRREHEQALELLAEYEKWEGDLIVDDRCWRDSCGEQIGSPVIGGEHYHELIRLQDKRNRLLGRFQYAEEVSK